MKQKKKKKKKKRMNMANVLYDMGQKKFESGDTAGAKGIFEEAEKEYREAIRMNPGNDNAYSNLGNVLVKLDRRDEGIALYQKALGMKEGNASAHNNLGGALFEMGRLDEAAAEFEKAIELDGKYLGAYTNFAMLRANQGRFAEAAKIQESAVRLKRGDPILLNMLGNFYFQAGLYGTSLEKYADVLDINKGNVDALYSSGSACARMSDYEKALSWYDKALAINPEYGPAKADRETVRKLLEKQTATARQQPPTPPTDGTPAQ